MHGHSRLVGMQHTSKPMCSVSRVVLNGHQGLRSINTLQSKSTSHRQWRTSRHASGRLSVRSYYQEADQRRRAPDSAPRSESEPPPPPPPLPPKKKGIFQTGPTVLATILFLLLGSGLWWWWIDSQLPQVYRDDTGVQYLFTEGGNQVVVGEDKQGRVYFIDRNGNFYYDTGDASLGFYMVSHDNKVYNLFSTKDGKREAVYVGNFDDLKSYNIASLGGIPVEELQKASSKALGRELTAFIQPAEPGKEPLASDFLKRGKPVPKVITEFELVDEK